MAFKYRQKKTIRRARRFLKQRKSAKTHRRTLTKRRIMGGGAKWNVKVYYFDTAIDYGDTPNTPFYNTPGTFTNMFSSEESEKFVFGTLTLPEFKKDFYNTRFLVNVNDNKYVAESTMFIKTNDNRFMISHFEKVSEINEELPIGAAQFPSAPLIETRPPPQKWWSFSKTPSVY